jgi:hypothetical protein
MVRLLETAALSVFLLCLAGCAAPEPAPAPWDGIRIGDLAPSRGAGEGGVEGLKIIRLNVYVFEMPAENVGVLDVIWQMLRAEPLRFNNYDAFRANSFMVGFGQDPLLNEVVGVLDGGGGRRVQTVSLLVPDGYINDVSVSGVPGERSVFYTAVDGSMKGVTVGPGRIALRLGGGILPGLRGLCEVGVEAVFVSGRRGATAQGPVGERLVEHVFGSAGFHLKMSPGDFLFLGPEKYITDDVSLASHFFSRAGPDPRIKMFLLPGPGEGGRPEPYYGPVVLTYVILCAGVSD